jgi:glutaminase
MNEEVLGCALSCNARNQAISQLLRSYGVIAGDPTEALDLYTRGSARST